MQLSDIEIEITRMVVERLINSKESTKRNELVKKFKSPQAVDRLASIGALRKFEDDSLVPSALGVDLCEDRDFKTRAKSSLEIVLRALQNLYYVTDERAQIYKNAVVSEVNKIQGETVPEVIERGLFFVTEFPALDSYGPQPGQARQTPFSLDWMTISERIVTVDIDEAWDERIRVCKTTMESIAEYAEAKSAVASLPVNESDDYKFARMAVEEALKSISEPDGRPRPKVGAIVVKNGVVLGVAHRGEVPGNHAEYIAMERKLRNETLTGATVYTTLEPCTTRNHPKIPCAVRLVERKVARVVIGMLDPDTRITGRGQRLLRRANIVTQLFPHDLMSEIEEMNRDFTDFCERQEVRLEAHATMSVEATITTPSTHDQRVQGQHWVEQLLVSLLRERGHRLDDPVRWTADFDHEMYTLEAKMGSNTKLWRLSFEALEDCVADENVQRTVERSLRMYFVPDADQSSTSKWKESMNEGEVVEALTKLQRREKLDQNTLYILDRDGYIATTPVDHMLGAGPELLFVSIKPRGQFLLTR